MSRTLNSITLQNADNDSAQLQAPIRMDAGRRCFAMTLLATITLAQDNIGAPGPFVCTKAQARLILNALCSAWTLKFGRAPQECIDDQYTFLELELIGMGMALRDQIFNGVNLNNYATGDVTIAAGASGNVKIGFVRYFAFEREATKIDEFCPYPSQMRDMELTLKRGVVATGIAHLTFAAQPITFRVRIDEIDSTVADGWAPVPRLARNNIADLSHKGPSNMGGLLGLYELSAPGASTAIDLFSLLRDGDSPLQESVLAADVVEEAFIRRPLGGADPNEICTELYELPDVTSIDKIPTGNQFEFRMPTQSIATPKTRWLYIPRVDAEYVQNVVSPNIHFSGGNKEGAVKKLITAPVARGEEVANHTAAISSVAAVKPGTDTADLHDGYLTTPNGAVLNLSPISEAAHKGASGAVARRILSNRLKSIPGASSPHRGDSTPLNAASAAVLQSGGHKKGA